MSTEEQYDMVWQTFLNTAKEVAPGIPMELLRKAYEIQTRHQFSQDSNESLQLMEKLIDEQIGGVK